MLNPKGRQRLVFAAVFATPLCIVKLCGWWFGAGSAVGAVQVAPTQAAELPAPAPRVRPQFTPAQLEAAEHLKRLAAEPFAATPMLYPPDEGEIEVIEPAVVSGTLQVTVAAIMDTRRGAIALINGQPRRIGDAVEGPWTIADIDSRTRTVELRHSETGETVRAKVAGPG